MRSDPRLERPDIQINMSAWSTAERNRDGIHPHPFPGITMSPVHLRPEGRGTVRLKSPDPLAPPEIRFNFLQSDYDMQALIFGIRTVPQDRRAAGAEAPMSWRRSRPAPRFATDAELADVVRASGVSNQHPVGTCRMGNGPNAVVDPRLRVHGIERAARGGRLDHAVDHRRQHQCADDHDRREGRGHDPGRRQAA